MRKIWTGAITIASVGALATGGLTGIASADTPTPTKMTRTIVTNAPAMAGRCTVKAYNSGGPSIQITHKGKDTPKYRNGLTRHRGRVMQLRTSRVLNRSSGNIAQGYRKGDRVWVDISHNGGRTWMQCGPFNGRDTPWYLHKHPNRWMRVCIDVPVPGGRSHKCADVGNKQGPGKRKWWDDH